MLLNVELHRYFIQIPWLLRGEDNSLRSCAQGDRVIMS